MGADDIDETAAGGSDGGQRRSQPDDSPFSRENAAATGGATPPAETPPGDGASRGQQRHVPVSPATAQVFGRPAGVRGSFASTPSSSRPAPQIAPPDAVLAEAFPGREIVQIDCRPIIWQNGSLHCLTMQLPAGLVKVDA